MTRTAFHNTLSRGHTTFRRFDVLTFRLFVCVPIWLAAFGPHAFGQEVDRATAGEIHPLAAKEEMIRDRLERFLDRVFRLQEQLSGDEPDNAARLARVVERAGELGLAEQLDEIVRLLGESPSLTEALDAQTRWVADADRLLAILLERDSDNKEREQRIERLEAYKQQLEQIVQREQGLRDKAAQAAGAEEASPKGDDPGKPPEAWDHTKEAEEQRDVAAQTRELGDQMRQDPATSGESRKTPQPGAAPGSSPPALQHLDDAQRDMNDAAEELDSNEPGEAAKSQDRAIDELQQAQQELEEALNQLRQEDREETLRDLETRFREMLSKQNSINAATARLYELGRESFRRAETLQLADLAAKERNLSQQAQVCGHVLDEEGTTIVFPRVVGQLAEDMSSLADRLGGLRVGPLTQDLQREVVDTLGQLLEAVKRMQQENEQQSASGGEDNENPPLLPPSAELKLLRSSQVRINARTAAIEAARAAGTESASSLAGLLTTTATRQAQCAESAREIQERQNRP